MTWPPSLARIRIVEGGRCKLSVWLPLIVVWPPLLALGIVLAPAVVVVALVLWRSGKGRAVLLVGPVAFWLFCTLRGLAIVVEKPGEQVEIRFQ